jgi:SAM-dependent methyltransferase
MSEKPATDPRALARPEDRTAIPQGLRDALLQNQLVLFVGSGPSLSAGAPTWRGLLYELIDYCGSELIELPEEEELRALVQGPAVDLLLAADYLRAYMGEKMDEFIQRRFARLSPTDVHRTIAGLSLGGMITTNFDLLLEDAIGRDVIRVVLPSDKFNLSRLKERWLVKLHGTCDQPSDIIIGAIDYARVLEDEGIVGALKRVFQQYTVLFVGVSLSDPDTLEVLAHLRAAFLGKNRRHYALMEKSSIGRIRQQYLLNQHQVQVITYQASDEDHPEVARFLRDLADVRELQHRGRMAKVLLMIRATYVFGHGAGEPRILVSRSNPQWTEDDQQERRDELNQRAFLLPSLKDDGQDSETLRREIAQWFGMEHEDVRVDLDPEGFSVRKFNPAFGRETDYSFRFAKLSFATRVLSFEEPLVTFGGKLFEWHTMTALRADRPTMNLNGDVLLEVSRRYGSNLEGLQSALTLPLSVIDDTYGARARTYNDLPWIGEDRVFEGALPSTSLKGAKGVLDLGCGTGLLGRYVLEHSDLPYVGFDVSTAMLERARATLRGSRRARVDRRDIALDSSEEKFDGWIFVLKNVLHLIPQLGMTIRSLRERFGNPIMTVIIETESPNLRCLTWIQALFELLGASHKRNWFLDGQVQLFLTIQGAEIHNEESVRQYIDVDRWIDSFELDDARRLRVEDAIGSVAPDVRRDMELRMTDDGRRSMLRLQRVIHVTLP